MEGKAARSVALLSRLGTTGAAAAEETAMEEHTAWCDEESNSKEDAITSSKRTIDDLSATMEDAKGTIITLTSTVRLRCWIFSPKPC